MYERGEKHIIIKEPLMLNVLLEYFFGGEEKVRKRKVFISFAIKDKRYRDFLVSQAKMKKLHLILQICQ